MKSTRWTALLLLTVVLLVFMFIPSTGRADMPIGTFMIVFPAMGILLVPIIVIEAWIGVHRISLRWGESFRVSIAANLVSTLIGIPITHFVLGVATYYLYGAMPPSGLLHLISMYMLQPFLLFPSWTSWSYPLIFIGWLIPMFFVTVWVEQHIARLLLRAKVNSKTIAKRWSLSANIASYSFITILLSVWFVFEVVSSL